MNKGAALTEHTDRVDRWRTSREDDSAVRLESARLSFGDRTLWDGLDLSVAPGEFVAVLGPNGSGKTSLLKVLLGQLGLSAGTARIAGSPARAGNHDIGYVPQQKTIDAGVQLRGVDLVGLGVDGHRWGLGLRSRAERKRKVAAAIADVGAQHFAHAPLESMSGGEQQRLRVAQALVGDPKVLLCDEPLLSLDLANQRLVAELIDRRRRTHDTAVLFVTHEINPILPLVDRVLYLVDGRFRIGTPDEVMTSAVLSELYRTQVDVLRVRGRLVVVGTGDTMDALGTAGGHCHGAAGDGFAPGVYPSDGARPSGAAGAIEPVSHGATSGVAQPGDPRTNGGTPAEPAPNDPVTDTVNSGNPVQNNSATDDATTTGPAEDRPPAISSAPATRSATSTRLTPSDAAPDNGASTRPRLDDAATAGTASAGAEPPVSATDGEGSASPSAAHPDPSGVRS